MAKTDYANLDDRAVVDTNVAAIIANRSPSSLTKDRLHGNGPPFLKIGGSVRYVVGDLRAWLMSRRRHSTSEYRTQRSASAQTKAATVAENEAKAVAPETIRVPGAIEVGVT